MARGGKRKGAGRKPTGKEAMLVRVAPDVRDRLKRDAKRQGRPSLSRHVELILADALRAAPPADAPTEALCYLIKQIVKVAQAFERADGPEFTWRNNAFDFAAFKGAVVHALERLAPTGKVAASRYPMAQTAEDMARILASAVFAYLAEGDALQARGDRQGAPRGSLFYAYPQAARDLGLAADKGRKRQ